MPSFAALANHHCLGCLGRYEHFQRTFRNNLKTTAQGWGGGGGDDVVGCGGGGGGCSWGCSSVVRACSQVQGPNPSTTLKEQAVGGILEGKSLLPDQGCQNG